MIDPVVGYLVQGALALLFFGASWHKWRTLPEFAVVLDNYRLLPAGRAVPLAQFVASLEAAVAFALVLPPVQRVGALGGALLLLAYAAAIAINLRRGRRDLDCGCGPRSDRRAIAPWMLARNVLLAAALALITLPWEPRPFGAVDVLTVTGGIAIAAFLYLAIDELLGRVVPRARALRRPA